jgi:hypothetical protein
MDFHVHILNPNINRSFTHDTTLGYMQPHPNNFD